MFFRPGPRLLVKAVVMLGSMTLAAGVQAQARVAAGAENGASRVLEIERVLGAASIQREGRAITMEPGFLLFSGERMTISPGSRVDLRLLRYGDIDAMSAGSGAGQLVFEKLPFSSWAVDLGTFIRLDSGVLRVRWARSGDAEDWPLAVLVDRWKTELTNGEFLFRRDERGMVTCSVSGKVELVDEAANVREQLTPGRCVTFNRNGTTDRAELAIAEWPELGMVVLREDLGGATATERSLAMNPRSEPTAPVVAPPPAPPASPVPPPIPPRVPLSVAEESVNVPAAEAKPAQPQPAEPVPAAAGPAAAPDLAPAPSAVAAPPASAEKGGQAVAPEAGAPSSNPPMQANAQAAAADSAATGTGPEWIVNVMTVTDPDAANQHIATLTNAGYPATLRKEVVRGRTSYRVIIGGISNEQGARRTAQLLATKMGYTAAWPLQKR